MGNAQQDFTYNVLVVPGSPAMVAEVSPADEVSAHLRATARELLADQTRPIDIVGSQDSRWRTELTGSFRAWGADVTVGGGNHLAELVARYLLGPAESTVRMVRSALRPLDPAALTVLVLDGSAGLTARAPLALIDGAPAAHEAMCEFLSGTGALPDQLAAYGVIEPDLWEELATCEPTQAQLIAHDSTLGVGRFIAAWQVEDA